MKLSSCFPKLLCGFAIILLTHCGSQKSDHNPDGNSDTPKTGGGEKSGDQSNTVAPDKYIVRGRWTLPMKSIGDGSSQSFELQAMESLQAPSSSSQAMSGTVAASVTFTVSNSNFSTPASSGVASYGHLDVTALKDNALRTCGTGGNAKCTSAVIRAYTTGTPGAGLWSTVEGVGLPITSGGKTVGLNVAGALAVGNFTIPSTKTVLKLSDFTSSTALQVPISVDFTDAPASAYATTLVVEYATN